MEANTIPTTLASAVHADVLGIKIPVLPPTPFVGLRPFNSNESLLFFGRSAQTVELLQQLHRTRFLAVVGSSGCGKSSLIYAGLIPKLKAGFLVEDREQWLIATMKPGDGPLRNLAAALLAAVVGGPHSAVEAFADEMRVARTQAIIERLTPTLVKSDANLLLLVDQFEESFGFGLENGNIAQRDDAADFVSILLALIQQRVLPIYVVMTMRSDFLGDCDNFYGLPEAMNHSQYLVPRLTRQQRQQAIEGPIRLFGQVITVRLLDRVLNDVGEQSDQLPVMQHALMRTWERWRQSTDPALDVPHYEAIGTIKDALSHDADHALAGMDAEDLTITARMLQALTNTDTRNRRIRYPMHLSGIEAITGASREQIMEIIERFRSSGRSFLTVTAEHDPLINISHESLIRQWHTLNTWVAEEEESARMYRRLAETAVLHQRDQAGLWGDPDLQLALNWRNQNQPNESWAARYHPAFRLAMQFLEESSGARKAELDRQADAAEHKLELEKATAVAEERAQQITVKEKAAKRFRWLAIILAVVSVLVCILTIVALHQRQLARLEQEKAQDQRTTALEQEQEALQQKRIAEETEQLANQRFQRIVKSVKLRQAVLSRDQEAIKDALATTSVETHIAFSAVAKEYPYKSVQGFPTYKFQIFPAEESIPGGMNSIALITYIMDHPTFLNPLIATGPDTKFRGTYDGVACLNIVTAVIEYTDLDRPLAIAQIDMCRILKTFPLKESVVNPIRKPAARTPQ